MTLTASAQLQVWRVDFETRFLPPNVDSIRDFDLRVPGCVYDAIVGLNVYAANAPAEIHVYEVDSTGQNVLQNVRYRDAGGMHIQGRSVTRSSDGQGYVVAGVQYSGVIPDTGIIVFRASTSGTIQWAKRIDLLDRFGNPYEIAVPKKILHMAGTYEYSICGYVRRGQQQDGFYLRLDDAGNVMFVVLYEDGATADHARSRIWIEDMEQSIDGVTVVIVGMRETEFYQPRPGPCQVEHAQAMVMLVDGMGMPLQGPVYSDPDGQCAGLKGVAVAEAGTEQYVVSVGWGDIQMNGTSSTRFAVTYGANLWQLQDGWVHYQWSDPMDPQQGKFEVDQFQDVTWWAVSAGGQDTVWGFIGVVGKHREAGWGTERGPYWFVRYEKSWGNHLQYLLQGFWWYTDGNRVTLVEELNRIERDEKATYMVGNRENYACLLRTEGRIPQRKPGGGNPECSYPRFESNVEKVKMVEEPIYPQIGQWHQQNLQLQLVPAITTHHRKCWTELD